MVTVEKPVMAYALATRVLTALIEPYHLPGATVHLTVSIGLAEVSGGDSVDDVLRRADLGSLVEAEQDWHRHAGQHTMPMPRITEDMTAPPVAKKPAKAWVETLF